MLTNTYECLAIILRSLRLVANYIRKPIRLIFATFWRICREYLFLHSQGYSPQCESSIRDTRNSTSTNFVTLPNARIFSRIHSRTAAHIRKGVTLSRFKIAPKAHVLIEYLTTTTAQLHHVGGIELGRIHTGSGSVPVSSEPYASGRLRDGFAFTLQTTDPPRTVRAHFAVYTLRLLRDRL